MRRIAWLGSVLVLAIPQVAAASEGESAFSIGAGVATWMHDHDHDDDDDDDDDDWLGPTVGGVLVASYERGFTDALSWRVDLSGGLHGIDGLSWSAVAAAGVVYRYDVIKYVPYAMLQLGGTAIGDGPIPDDDSPELDPVVLVGAGVDLLRDRRSSWGVETRVALGADVVTATLGARFTWRWGFF